MNEITQGWETLLVRSDGDRVEVQLNRPEARNALNSRIMEELTELARRLRLRTDVAAVILHGADSYFSAGADLQGSSERASAPSLMERRRAASLGPDMCQAWAEIEAVTIAAIEGFCIGGGCALVAACDFRIMGAGAYLRLPEVPLGINMSWRTLPRLVALMGPARAKAFVMFGEKLEAERCHAIGMADALAPAGEALATARIWAGKVGALPPLPVRMTKQAIDAIAAATAQASIYMDRDQYLLTAGTSDFREGVQSFFERRPGKFTGS